MDPSSLEMGIMLKTKKDLWNAKNVDDVIELFRHETKAKAVALKETTNSSRLGSKRTFDAIISVLDESEDEEEEEMNEEDGEEETEDEEDEF